MQRPLVMPNPWNVVTELPRPAEPVDPYLFRIRDLIYQSSGIFHTENKFYFLRDRCLRRMEALRVATLGEYFDHLTLRLNRDTELRHLLNEVAVGETCFFRNLPQLEALRKSLIPSLVAAKSQFGFTRMRVWSAGCSTGEEPYTLAMVLLEEAGGLLAGWKLEVFASDLNDHSLNKAREGVYSEYALRNIPPYFKTKYMRPHASLFEVRDEVRALVNFSRLNLRDDSQMVFMKGMDVIFCCNVLIYFGAEAKRRVIQHFFNNLLPNGFLFLGHSESLFGLNEDFKLTHFPLATAYLKPGRQNCLGDTR
jgi:chemotaxis protein methyltransferase CheR